MTDQQHAVEPEYGTGKKNLTIYVVGLVLCVILTLIPFQAVNHDAWSHATIMWVLVLSALAQFLVQVVCFLRLSASTAQGRANIMSFISAIVVVFVVVGGSVWIMLHLSYNMMH